MKFLSSIEKNIKFTPFVISISYAVISALWVLVTDYMLSGQIKDPALLTEFQTIKGWFFILMTALLLYYFIRSSFRKIEQSSSALITSENKYRMLLEEASDGIILLDETGKILQVNSRICLMLGYNSSDMTGKNVADFIAKEELEKRPLNFYDIFSGVVVLSERSLFHKNGNVVFTEISSKMLGPKLIQSIIRDISMRKKAEKELRESEQQYRLLFRENPYPMWVYDLETLRFLAVNNAAVGNYGYSHEEFLSMTIKDIRPEEDLKTLNDNIKSSYTDLQQSGPWRHRKKNGEIIQVEIISNYMVFSGRKARIVLANDITERKAVMEALQVSELRYKSLFEKSPISIWEEDFSLIKNHIDLLKITGVGNFREYLDKYPEEVASSVSMIRILDVNEATVELYQAKDKDDILSGMTMLFDQEFYSAQKESIIAVSENKTRFEIETSCRTLKGKRLNIVYRWVVAQGYEMTYGKILLSIVDITERKLAEKALKESEERFSSYMKMLPGIAMMKDLSGRYIYANETWKKLTKREEYFGLRDTDIWPPDIAAQFTDNDRYVIKSGEVLDTIEYSNYNDEVKYWLISKFPIRNIVTGQFMALGAIGIDITDRRKAEDEVKRLNEELEQRVIKRTQQLEASNQELEAFSYSISHDLRTPLRAITGFSKILLDDYSKQFDSEAQRMMNIIEKNAFQMEQLIEDLLAFSKLLGKEKTEIRLNMRELVNSVAEEMKKENIDREISIKIKDMPEVKADRSMIKQVWINLISNAIKFTKMRDCAEIEIGGSIQAKEAVYYIRDNGIGFDMAYANKLFKAFQRLHNSEQFEGTGVGLAMVQRIIKRHEGHIWAEGEVDKGAIIYFALPAI
ncbi:MAG: PAS domain S-box protein [Bacteroidota bacterium]|nr:PAS domain S-box protein [Bacteroidota bacterium]MDP4191367.1 PAS domain S-box protein [Bacteroidota bacterium]MDP4194309.1 PAS domain S-box protein [Bacteroidota bacterium]